MATIAALLRSLPSDDYSRGPEVPGRLLYYRARQILQGRGDTSHHLRRMLYLLGFDDPPKPQHENALYQILRTGENWRQKSMLELIPYLAGAVRREARRTRQRAGVVNSYEAPDRGGQHADLRVWQRRISVLQALKATLPPKQEALLAFLAAGNEPKDARRYAAATWSDYQALARKADRRLRQ